MDITKRARLEQVGVRIDPTKRKLVKELAKEKGVSESDIYRAIIDSFFTNNVNKLDTICIQDEAEKQNAIIVSDDTQLKTA